ncbi:acetylglutamate kinase [Flavobacterium sp. NKUCC04_CG]|uniref:acetylglutamate kinase n=1 Tax=Flavobacterium sp. NKUCC04_CG TaxID=2842121 RepID=UPI001C5B6F9C|nr:acetylglutamate kinase [Flavobacterium sp. NKUCC04_CG]MBW3518902.1 acetylglutamate kinase [Flavobacterium sp. NKUCC04_CG]
MKKLTIVKIGGQILDDETALSEFVSLFVQLSGEKILVHGGGKLVTELAVKMGIEPQLIEGRRITDQASLKLATMVYAGFINKNLVAQLQQKHCNALGLTGADAQLIQTQKRPATPIDFGWVGDLYATSVDAERIAQFLEWGLCPVFSAITHDGQGQLLNTNADDIAAALAIALTQYYEVSLLYCFEKKGVLSDINNENSVVPLLSFRDKEQLLKLGIIAQGMIPKINNAWKASQAGVTSVRIQKSGDLLNPDSGTRIQF